MLQGRWAGLAVGVSMLGLGVVECVNDNTGTGPAQGSLGGVCFSNGTCNAGLVCALSGNVATCQLPDASNDAPSNPDVANDAPSNPDVATDAPTDANPDAAMDAPTDGDGGGCGSGLSCELCNVSGYTPITMSKPTTVLNACTSTQITDFVTACLGSGATQTTCQTWQNANADAGSCVSCVFTNQSAAAWGPIVCTSTGCSLNSPGCVDLELGQVSQEKQAGGAGSCGDALGSEYGCESYACGTCSGTSDFSKCTQSALANECKPYVTATNSATQCAGFNSDAAPPAAAKCVPQTDTGFVTFVNVFCGTGP